MFGEIDAIVADLRAGVNVGKHLPTLDARLDTVLTSLSTVGARHATILDAASSNLDRKVDLESMRAGIEDVDIQKIVLELKMQEVTYQSALAVTARTLQPTLMDFLR
jgi:flagellar hook-associated protein 3 FlgL